MNEGSYLTSEEMDVFRSMEEMFATSGWQRLVKQLKEESDSLPEHTFWNAESWEDILRARVRLEERSVLLHYETLLQSQRDALIQQRRAAAEVRAEEDFANE